MTRKTREELEEERNRKDWEKAHPTLPEADRDLTDARAENNKNDEDLSMRYDSDPWAETKETTANESSGGIEVQQYPGGSLEKYIAGGKYDDASLESYLSGLAAEGITAINNAEKQMPMYGGSYDAQLNDAYNKIVGRAPFQYDIENDPIFKQYADQYMRRGELASEDVMGKAAAMTGGYGNSYAQTAGAQTYQDYLQKINDAVPEFYGMALDRYDAEGEALLREYSMLSDLAEGEYTRTQEAKNELLNYAVTGYNLTDDQLKAVGLDRDMVDAYVKYMNTPEVDSDAATVPAIDYKENRENLIDLIDLGYIPTSEDLAAAGMTREQALVYLNKAGTYEILPNGEYAPAGTYQENLKGYKNELDLWLKGGATPGELGELISGLYREKDITKEDLIELKRIYLQTGRAY